MEETEAEDQTTVGSVTSTTATSSVANPSTEEMGETEESMMSSAMSMEESEAEEAEEAEENIVIPYGEYNSHTLCIIYFGSFENSAHSAMPVTPFLKNVF